MKIVWFSVFLLLIIACHHKAVVERATNFPKQAVKVMTPTSKQNVWVFFLAGQSNMAGRGLVEPRDTIADERILTINKEGHLIIAKEPLHWYEPERTGLDCGFSFGQSMIKKIPRDNYILLIPTAVGGSSISQWIGDSLYRNVKLLSNFREKVEIAKRYGTIKGILWHQGESDANDRDIPHYKEKLGELFRQFRSISGNNDLPVLLGELGSFSKDREHFSLINKAIHDYSATDKNTTVISTGDLKDRGDSLHFNSKSQRIMGQRFAEAYLKKFN